jgi:hypothetical protein
MAKTITPKVQFLPRRISDLGNAESTQNRNPERSNPKMLLAKEEPRKVEKTVNARR